jgi:hypothetical protein
LGTIRRLFLLLVTCLVTVLALAAPAFAMLPQFFDQLTEEQPAQCGRWRTLLLGRPVTLLGRDQERPRYDDVQLH